MPPGGDARADGDPRVQFSMSGEATGHGRTDLPGAEAARGDDDVLDGRAHARLRRARRQSLLRATACRIDRRGARYRRGGTWPAGDAVPDWIRLGIDPRRSSRRPHRESSADRPGDRAGRAGAGGNVARLVSAAVPCRRAAGRRAVGHRANHRAARGASRRRRPSRPRRRQSHWRHHARHHAGPAARELHRPSLRLAGGICRVGRSHGGARGHAGPRLAAARAALADELWRYPALARTAVAGCAGAAPARRLSRHRVRRV
jgi:hypothetical protein